MVEIVVCRRNAFNRPVMFPCGSLFRPFDPNGRIIITMPVLWTGASSTSLKTTYELRRLDAINGYVEIMRKENNWKKTNCAVYADRNTSEIALNRSIFNLEDARTSPTRARQRSRKLNLKNTDYATNKTISDRALKIVALVPTVMFYSGNLFRCS